MDQFERNFILKAQMADVANPAIWRTLSCPSHATFEELHEALQIAFGWARCHLYRFEVEAGDPGTSPELSPAEALVVSLARPTGCLPYHPSLLNIVDEPTEESIPAFDTGISRPQPPKKIASEIELSEIFGDERYNDKVVNYKYDFGDNWSHKIVLIGREDAAGHFICRDGEGHPCEEDVGGTYGWRDLKAAYRASRPTEEQMEHMEWYETYASNGERQGLGNGRIWNWSKARVNRQLTDLGM